MSLRAFNILDWFVGLNAKALFIENAGGRSVSVLKFIYETQTDVCSIPDVETGYPHKNLGAKEYNCHDNGPYGESYLKLIAKSVGRT